jgi:DNA-binding IclR family transcriptional regulator
MPQSSSTSQTLSRGIRVLEILADSPTPRPLLQLATELGVHRSVAYRLVRTLEDHRLVSRSESGAFQLGPGLAALARAVAADLQGAARPELETLANELGMTAFVAVLDHDDVITIASAEPVGRRATVAQRPGSRHSLIQGAPGIVIQSMLTASELKQIANAAPRPEAHAAREAGFASSHDEVIDGLSSIAVPLPLPGHPRAALAAVYLTTEVDPVGIAAKLTKSARAIASRLG